MVYSRSRPYTLSFNFDPLLWHQLAVGVNLQIENFEVSYELAVVVLPSETVNTILYDILR